MRRILCLLLLCCSILVAGSGCAQWQEPVYLRLHQIANGHSDCYLLTCQETVILVDCGVETGKNRTPDRLLTYLRAVGIDHVDAHIVTHWHDDHAGNLNLLNSLYGTENTVVYGVSSDLPEKYQPLALGTYRQMRDGDRFAIGPLEVFCTGPATDTVTGEENRDSLNFLVTYGEVRFFFTGDWVDYTVRRRHEDALNRVDVLSFPHHGLSPMAIRPDTMRLLSPRVILIPGAGSSEDKVKAFALKECSLKRYPRFYSNRDGNVLLTCDGVNLWSAYSVEPGTLPRGSIVP